MAPGVEGEGMRTETVNGKPYFIAIDTGYGDDQTAYTCPKCFQSFVALFLFHRHVREVHPVESRAKLLIHQ